MEYEIEEEWPEEAPVAVLSNERVVRQRSPSRINNEMPDPQFVEQLPDIQNDIYFSGHEIHAPED